MLANASIKNYNLLCILHFLLLKSTVIWGKSGQLFEPCYSTIFGYFWLVEWTVDSIRLRWRPECVQHTINRNKSDRFTSKYFLKLTLLTICKSIIQAKACVRISFFQSIGSHSESGVRKITLLLRRTPDWFTFSCEKKKKEHKVSIQFDKLAVQCLGKVSVLIKFLIRN